MKNIFSRKFLFISIVVLAAFLRLWKLGDVPPSPSNDEASIGYNAYSVLKTGADEYGSFPLISQRGYDDWRRSTYLFLSIPFIALVNLQVIAIRLPAVLLSILTIWAIYDIVLLLFRKQDDVSQAAALIATLLLAISPWHIYISRLGHESNAYLSFFVFGVLFFLKGVNNTRKLFWSVIFFTVAMISYYAGQVLVPLFVVGLVWIYKSALIEKIRRDKKALVGGIIFALILIPIFWTIFSPEALIRFRGTSTFSPQAHQEEFNKVVQLRNYAAENHDLIGMVIYNRRFFPVRVAIEGYISHFDMRWLFANSSGEPFKVPNMGLLYPWEFPFILIGIAIFLFGTKFDARAKKLLFFWFFLSPLPASIATQAPHAMRAYAIIPVFQIFAALGLVYTWNRLQKFKTAGLVGFGSVVVVSLLTFYTNYFIIFPKEQSASFEYALAQAISYVLSQEKNYDKVVFANQDNLYQSYMPFLYYSRYDPSLYQREGGTKSGGFAETHQFGKYEFRPIHWAKEKANGKVLYIGNVSDFPTSIDAIQTFTSLDGKPTVKVVVKL